MTVYVKRCEFVGLGMSTLEQLNVELFLFLFSAIQAFHKVVRSWASKKFMTGCVILFPIAITFYFTWWFIHFVDGFFSPIYAQLGINIFGLGFITSVTFIFFVGVFMSSWVGASVLGIGEWIIKRMPLVRHIYNASKQISAAISPDQNKQAFKEAVIIRHPRIGEYAFGFITSSVSLQSYCGQEDLYCVYVPTNHLYIGDIFMVNSKDVIRPNLSVREGIADVINSAQYAGGDQPKHSHFSMDKFDYISMVFVKHSHFSMDKFDYISLVFVHDSTTGLTS
uniref:Protein LIKE COV 3 n=1 Tax=Aegilops tauschii TaxID=37682 RepID=M8D343_AEGTA